MQKIRTKISIILLIMFLVTSLSGFPASAQDILDLKAESAILVDGDTGKILYEKNPDQLQPVASMTKMMTEYLVLEGIKNGRISWNQKTSISDYVFKVSQNRNLSNVPLRKDQQYTVKELFEAAAIYSANGAAIALAELVGGSEGAFVEMMNKKANEIGLKDYKFVNSTGLNNQELMGMHPSGTGSNDENFLSAKATATLAYALLRDYPEVLETSRIDKKTFRPGTTDAINMDNWNWMLPTLVYGYEGVDGLKTGSSDTAGYSFTGTAKRNGLRLIVVVIKADSYETRFSQSRKLLDYGFSNFTKTQVLPAGFAIKNRTSLPVFEGKPEAAEVESSKPLVTTVKRGEEKLYKPVYKLDAKLTTKKQELLAPLKEKQRIGTLIVEHEKSNLGYLTTDGPGKDGAPLVTKTEVKKAGWFTKFFRGIGSFFSTTLKNLIADLV